MTSIHELEKSKRAFELSRRAQEMPASPIRKLSPLADAAKARGTKVYHLNIGQPDIETPACMLDRLRQISTKVLEYSPSTGTPEFLRSLQKYYQRRLGLDVSTNQILATTGGSEAILFAFMACANEGDEVMVVEPFYANYRAFATMASLKIVPVTSRGRDGFHVPPRHVWERALSSRTRCVIICNPSNPTGTVYTREELDMVASFCRDNNLFMISDEVYREFVYDGRSLRSVMTFPGLEQHTVLVDSVSKRYSLCGARVGNIVCRNRALMDAVLRFGQTRLCPPTVEQWACAALGEVPPDYIRGVIAEYQKRRDVVVEALGGVPGVLARKPEGAFYVCARLPVDDGNRFAEFLLKDFSLEGETVLVAPADGFYATPGLGRDEVRIAYVLEEPKLRRAMRVLTAALAAYPGRTTGAAALPA